MKTIAPGLPRFAIVALLVALPARVYSQAQQTVALSGSELLQNGAPGTPIDNGKTSTIKPPLRFTVNTATLLKDLAADETLAGNWFNQTGKVPANARLRIGFAAPADFSSLSFHVVSGTNSIDVSNILSAKPAGSNEVVTLTFKDTSGQDQPPFTHTDYLGYTIAYDSTAVGGTTTFTVTGAATCSSSATAPNAKSGLYTEKDSFTLTSGSGSGVIAGLPLVLSGVTISASGSAGGDCGCGLDEPFPISGPSIPGGDQSISTGSSSETISAPTPPSIAP